MKNANSTNNRVIPLILLVIFFPIGLYYMWAKTNWRTWIKVLVNILFAAASIVSFFTAISNGEGAISIVVSTALTAYTIWLPIHFLKGDKKISDWLPNNIKISVTLAPIFHPDQYEQNSAESVVTETGLYDFEHFSAAETDTINQVLATAKRKYPRHYRGIGLAIESFSVVYKPRYILHEIIIIKYRNSKNPLDRLAVGLAYKTKGAYFRKPALEYMKKSVENIKKSEWKRISLLFSKCYIYSDMSNLYEGCYQFEDALHYAELSANEQGSLSQYDITRIGDIYRKIDINLCVKYYENLIQSGGAGEYAAIAEEDLKKARELQARGYKYRPRPKKKPDYFDGLEEKIHLAALRFI